MQHDWLIQTLREIVYLPDVWQTLLYKIEIYATQPVTGMIALKNRNEKKVKGDIWEEFCLQWLVVTERAVRVWKVKDLPAEVCQSLKISTQDNGIDLIMEDKTGAYSAVQCKYRKKKNESGFAVNTERGIRTQVKWNEISTFVGLCAMSGPWKTHIIMTNCDGMGYRKIHRTPKDISWCYGTFKNTTLPQWLKLAQLYTENTLNTFISSPVTITSLPPAMLHPDIDNLRTARIKRFEIKETNGTG